MNLLWLSQESFFNTVVQIYMYYTVLYKLIETSY